MFRIAMICLALVSSTLFAADPNSPQIAKTFGPPVVAKPNRYLVAASEVKRKEQLRIESVLDVLSATTLVQEAYVVCLLDLKSTQEADRRLMRLLNESEDLRQAREDARRFWMNNQPSVLEYTRLKGAIGP